MNLFKDERITFFALVDQERLALSPENKTVIRMIKDLNFEMHYIPCFWEEETNFIQEALGIAYGLPKISDQIIDFKDHIAFVSRGSPLDALDEALNFEYRNPENGKLNLNHSANLDWEKIRINAKIQRILYTNWEKILFPYFNGSGTDEKDRIKRAIYEIIDWMNEERIFTMNEAIDFISNTSIKISKKQKILKSVILTLLIFEK